VVVNTVSARSVALPRFVAWSMPSGTPTRNVSASDVPPSSSEIGAASATLNVQVTPWLRPTTVRFEYGPSAAYGFSTPEIPVGSDGAPHSVSSAISGLADGATYHVRAVATNSIGSVAGADQTFVTLASIRAKTPPPPHPCKRGFVKKRGKCVRKKRRAHHRKGRHSHG